MRASSHLVLPFALAFASGCGPHPVDGLGDQHHVVQLEGVWASDLYCVRLDSGFGGCFEHAGAAANRFVPFPLESAARVVDIAADRFRACAVYEDGLAMCWGVPMASLAYGIPETLGFNVAALDVHEGRACRIDRDGHGMCELIQRGERIEADGVIAASAGSGCLLRGDGSAVCPEGELPADLYDGVSVLVSLDPVESCGVTVGGGVLCWSWEGGEATLAEASLSDDATRQLQMLNGGGRLTVGESGELTLFGYRQTYVSEIDAQQPSSWTGVDLGGPIHRFVPTRYASCTLYETGRVRCWHAPRQRSLGGG